MRVFTCNNFTGHNPVGTSAVVVAQNRFQAAAALSKKLSTIGLEQSIKEQDLIELDTRVYGATILNDGDY